LSFNGRQLLLLAGKRTQRRLIPALAQFRYPCRSGPELRWGSMGRFRPLWELRTRRGFYQSQSNAKGAGSIGDPQSSHATL